MHVLYVKVKLTKNGLRTMLVIQKGLLSVGITKEKLQETISKQNDVENTKIQSILKTEEQ